MCNDLQIQLRCKEIVEIDCQKTFRLDVNGQHICSHRVDFLLTYPDGHKEVLEVKGFVNPVWPIKKKLFEALYPDIPYKVVTK